MSQPTLHSQMIKFALTETLAESKKAYQVNENKLDDFEASIADKSTDKMSAVELQQKADEFVRVSEDQEKAKALLRELAKTEEAYKTLKPGEQNAMHRRLNDKSGDLTLVLQRRNGQILAQAS